HAGTMSNGHARASEWNHHRRVGITTVDWERSPHSCTNDARAIARVAATCNDCATMKAVVATRYGGPEVLDLVERADPDVGPRDVSIDVKAASLNPIDFKIRDGKVKLVLRLKPPIALGCDVAGVVRAVGAEVTRFRAGDEVYVRLEKDRMGALAERAGADERVVAAKPKRASFDEPAAIPRAALTALRPLLHAAASTA